MIGADPGVAVLPGYKGRKYYPKYQTDSLGMHLKTLLYEISKSSEPCPISGHSSTQIMKGILTLCSGRSKRSRPPTT